MAVKVHDYRREALGAGREVRRFEAKGQGRYEVEGVGPRPSPGDQMRFTLKGSDTLELQLDVRTVTDKVIPTNGFVVELEGPDFDSLDIHRWQVVCDRCAVNLPFEFAAPEGAPPAALGTLAEGRIAALGWLSDGDAQLCPSCKENR